MTAESVKKAAQFSSIRILTLMHEIDPALVFTAEVANLSAGYPPNRYRRYDVVYWMWKTLGILPTDLRNDSAKEWVADMCQQYEPLRQ
jgi:hypothetical protein